MSVSIPLERLLSVQPIRGKAMPIVAIAMVVAPTLLRALMEKEQGDGFCSYLPFVTLAAMVLSWRGALTVAVVSGFLADYLFEGTRYEIFENHMEIIGLVNFGLASALIIGLAGLLRKTMADPLWLGIPNHKPKEIVFSRRAGQACVSWYDGRSFVPLGPADEVEAKMRDFLAQQDLGRRLTAE